MLPPITVDKVVLLSYQTILLHHVSGYKVIKQSGYQQLEAYVFYLKDTMYSIRHLLDELGVHTQARWPSFHLAINEFKLEEFLDSTLQHEVTRW